MAGTRLYLGKSNFQRNMKTAGSRGGEDERGAGGVMEVKGYWLLSDPKEEEVKVLGGFLGGFFFFVFGDRINLVLNIYIKPLFYFSLRELNDLSQEWCCETLRFSFIIFCKVLLMSESVSPAEKNHRPGSEV